MFVFWWISTSFILVERKMTWRFFLDAPMSPCFEKTSDLKLLGYLKFHSTLVSISWTTRFHKIPIHHIVRLLEWLFNSTFCRWWTPRFFSPHVTDRGTMEHCLVPGIMIFSIALPWDLWFPLLWFCFMIYWSAFRSRNRRVQLALRFRTPMAFPSRDFWLVGQSFHLRVRRNLKPIQSAKVLQHSCWDTHKMEVEQPIVTSAEPEALSPRGHTWTFSGDFGVMGSFRDKVAGQVLVWWQSLTWYFSFKLGTVGDISWLELFWNWVSATWGLTPFQVHGLCRWFVEAKWLGVVVQVRIGQCSFSVPRGLCWCQCDCFSGPFGAPWLIRITVSHLTWDECARATESFRLFTHWMQHSSISLLAHLSCLEISIQSGINESI